ncbi:uncharacterized protein LOC123315437 [Coccinella septempunctata]|uniref:uncharacterized protein LOC123315437 n=1 Tax=Coccinella septempunctata TaxID=41139 RepID=UPI001D07BF07|nr:uncharacterized protein LOC123315437 [Coccinella septempunctata]
MGDLNARTGSKDNDTIVGKYGEQITNTNGQRLVDLCHGLSLKIMNGFFPHKNIHKFTWTQPTRKLSSIIDYIIMKQRSRINNLDVRVYRGSECGSDHHLVVTRLEINYRRKISRGEDEGNNYTLVERKYNLDSFRDESTQFLYKLRLATKLQQVQKEQSARELYNEIKTCIHEAAEEALGRKRKLQRNSEWWTKQVEEVVREKKRAYHHWLSTKKDEDRKIYVELNRKAKRQVERSKNERWEKTCEEVEIKKALKESKNKKAAGPGDIPIELIKNAPEILLELIKELFNKCIHGDQVPEDWNLGYISSIYKKGDKKLCQNYRDITVISAMGRL